jgi:5-methyltetrahydropteroyltriglutamate--homocysteine methyltransferase
VSARTTPPFRADHVGSLLRPPELLSARRRHAAGEISAQELRAVEDAAIREMVRRQEEVGLRSATDGELRRGSWHMDFILALAGIEAGEERLRIEFQNDLDPTHPIEFMPAAPHVTGKVRLERTIFAEDFSALRSFVRGATAKLTIPSPSMVHYGTGRDRIDRATYPDLEQFWSDLSAAYAAELRGLWELGCTYLQLDDTTLAYMNDPRQREYVASLGGDPERQHERYIATINRALAGRPPGMVVTTHSCRGNYRSAWRAQGGYDYVAEALFGELDVDGFFVEYDDARSGSFEPLRYVPRDKVVVLGLVSSKRPELESKDELKRRIEEAGAYVDAEQLCLSPQCGFSSTVDGNQLTIEQQFAKLRLVVETAGEVWG